MLVQQDISFQVEPFNKYLAGKDVWCKTRFAVQSTKELCGSSSFYMEYESAMMRSDAQIQQTSL